MKTFPSRSRRPRRGFTLVELLVVIAIIAILAAMLLPVLAAVKKHAKRVQAQVQVQDLATAIQKYDSDYGRFPVSDQIQALANQNNNSDFTFGGSLFASNLNQLPPGDSIYTTNNSEVIAILMDLTNYPNNYLGGAPTVNADYVKNPQRTLYLNPKLSGWDPSQNPPALPGVGNDLVYRDPWGNPYVISMDLNYNGVCEDAFYKLPTVSAGNVDGLILQPDKYYGAHGKVMVWSAGPDGKIDSSKSANLGVNKDNVISWQ